MTKYFSPTFEVGSLIRNTSESIGVKKETLALFDFDGTITSRDTLVQFIIHSKGPIKFYLGLVMLLPILALYGLRIIPSWRAKEIMLTLFFRGMDGGLFQIACSRFAAEKIPSLIRSAAMEKIREHQQNNHRIIIVSASPENWVGEWARSNNVECIATRLKMNHGVITGRLDGKNCKGEEKVRRIKEYIDLSEFGTIYTYGDSKADLPMLYLGSKRYFKPFRD